MKSKELKIPDAKEIGQHIEALVNMNKLDQAYDLLKPALTERTPFSLLDCIGEVVGQIPLVVLTPFLNQIAANKAEGGWVIIASALRQHITSERTTAFELARGYIIAADIWYAPDILGERVPGPSLVENYELTIPLIEPWRNDSNRWIRRTVGIVIHFWAKRSRGKAEFASLASQLLEFIGPMFEEQDMDAVKGVGWGVKTMGRNYPELTTDWLVQQLVSQKRPHRALMLRKALTYLSDEQRARITGKES
jgi:hypothetical protein